MSTLQPLTDWDQEALALSSLLRDYGRYTQYGLSERDYTSGKHVAIARAADAIVSREETVTFDSVAIELQRTGLDGLTGRKEGLLELRKGPPGVVFDPERLRQLTALRGLRDGLLEAAQLAGAMDMGAALARVDEAMRFGQSGKKSLDLDELVHQAVAEGIESSRGKGKLIFPGCPNVRQVFGGFRPGGMYVLAAASNVGKSFVAQTWTTGMIEAGVPMGWISLEDPQLTTGSRQAGMLLGVEPKMIEQGNVTHELSEKLNARSVWFKQNRNLMRYVDLTGGTEVDVCAAMSSMQAQGAKVIVVDYIGVVTASKEQQDRRNEIRWISIRLKAHAKRLGVALLVVSQITQPRDNNDAHEPGKYSLRESGDLTNAAEAIIVCWRESEEDNAPVEVKVAKSKIGGVGMWWQLHRDRENFRMLPSGPASLKPKAQRKSPASRGY